MKDKEKGRNPRVLTAVFPKLITGDRGIGKSHEDTGKTAGPSPLTRLHTGGTTSDPGRASATSPMPCLACPYEAKPNNHVTTDFLFVEQQTRIPREGCLCPSGQVTSRQRTMERSRWQGRNSAAYAWRRARGFVRISSFTQSANLRKSKLLVDEKTD